MFTGLLSGNVQWASCWHQPQVCSAVQNAARLIVGCSDNAGGGDLISGNLVSLGLFSLLSQFWSHWLSKPNCHVILILALMVAAGVQSGPRDK